MTKEKIFSIVRFIIQTTTLVLTVLRFILTLEDDDTDVIPPV